MKSKPSPSGPILGIGNRIAIHELRRIDAVGIILVHEETVRETHLC